jgi:Protein of unknown function (DUF3467)
MADEPNRQINFTIVPDESSPQDRVYANFCALSHTPFDFTLTFCEVMPLSDKDIREAASEHVVRAPVRARVALPPQVVPGLIAALQEQLRGFTESQVSSTGWTNGPVH